MPPRNGCTDRAQTAATILAMHPLVMMEVGLEDAMISEDALAVRRRIGTRIGDWTVFSLLAVGSTAAIYEAIDASPGFYRGPVDRASRSVMNVVFRLPSGELEKKFVDEAKGQAMVGLKGHRSVGGIRASLYNAVEPEWAAALADFMKQFAKQNG